MKISDAKNIYAAQLDTLWSRKRELSKLLRDDPKAGAAQGSYDRVELSRELSAVEDEYDQMSKIMEHIRLRETAVQNAEAAKQQGDAMSKAMEGMLKCLEIARRISEGAKVPPADEKMLMDYSHELYMAAKNMALLHMQEKQKEYDSLVEEDAEDQQPEQSASEIAAGAEVDLPLPETAAPEFSAAE